LLSGGFDDSSFDGVVEGGVILVSLFIGSGCWVGWEGWEGLLSVF